MQVKSLTWAKVIARRLARSYLLEPVPRAQLAEVVGAVCGIQAQVLTAAELGIAVRVQGVTRAEIEEELWVKRSLVKTSGPRGTLHLLPSAELPLWMAAMRAQTMSHEKHWYESAGLKAAQGQALLEAIGEALDGRALTREELADEVARRVGRWARANVASLWGAALGPAYYTGRLCFGPSRGSRVTFVRVDQWTGSWQELDPEASLLEVCRRYLRAYGPATSRDFAGWFHLEPGAARRVFHSLSGELEPVEVEGHRAWMMAADVAAPWTEAYGSLRLLPRYDCYVLGSRFGRAQVVPAAARARAARHKNGRFEGATGIEVLLVDGIVSGIWERRKRGKQSEIRVEPAGIRLSAIQRKQLAKEARRIGEFVGEEVKLAVGSLE